MLNIISTQFEITIGNYFVFGQLYLLNLLIQGGTNDIVLLDIQFEERRNIFTLISWYHFNNLNIFSRSLSKNNKQNREQSCITSISNFSIIIINRF